MSLRNHPYDVSTNLFEYGAQGIIPSGGPSPVTEGDTPRAPERRFFKWVFRPMGIGDGTQDRGAATGGKVMTAEASGKAREFGYSEVRAHGPTAPLNDIAGRLLLSRKPRYVQGLMSHGDSSHGDVGRVCQEWFQPPPARLTRDGRREPQALRRPVLPGSDLRWCSKDAPLEPLCTVSPGCGADWVMGDHISDAVDAIPRLLVMTDVVSASPVAMLRASCRGAHPQGDRQPVDPASSSIPARCGWNEGDMVMETPARNLGVIVIRVDAVDDLRVSVGWSSDPERSDDHRRASLSSSSSPNRKIDCC
ncbi:MAG: hypothetical protein IPF44_11395 [Betaproteobacteria bacterium]|nr:hypothetical protein [Betaproteobacteria bacterium]